MGDMADLAVEQGLMSYMDMYPPFPEESTAGYLAKAFSDKGEDMAVVKRKMPRGTKKGKLPRMEAGPDLELSLPTERSTPSIRIGDFAILLFGEKKIGKTDLSAEFPDTFHMMAEPGGKAQAIFQRPIPNWRTFTGYVRLLEKDRKFKTAAIDTADFLYNHCFDHVTHKLGIEHPAEEAYGKGWKAIRDEFTKWIIRLMNTGKGIIFISHATEREVKMRGGEKYDRLQPTMGGQARDILEALVDLWFYYGYDGRHRYLTIQGSDYIGAGHRLKHNFQYADGRPIERVYMGRSAKEGYHNLIAAFHNTYTDPRIDDERSSTIVKKKKLSIKKKR